jgi:hypothetical protein
MKRTLTALIICLIALFVISCSNSDENPGDDAVTPTFFQQVVHVINGWYGVKDTTGSLESNVSINPLNAGITVGDILDTRIGPNGLEFRMATSDEPFELVTTKKTGQYSLGVFGSWHTRTTPGDLTTDNAEPHPIWTFKSNKEEEQTAADEFRKTLASFQTLENKPDSPLIRYLHVIPAKDHTVDVQWKDNIYAKWAPTGNLLRIRSWNATVSLPTGINPDHVYVVKALMDNLVDRYENPDEQNPPKLVGGYFVKLIRVEIKDKDGNVTSFENYQIRHKYTGTYVRSNSAVHSAMSVQAPEMDESELEEATCEFGDPDYNLNCPDREGFYPGDNEYNPDK